MIINNVDVRQRSRGLVGVTDVGVVYTPSTMCSAGMFLLPVTGHPVPVIVSVSLCV